MRAIDFPLRNTTYLQILESVLQLNIYVLGARHCLERNRKRRQSGCGSKKVTVREGNSVSPWFLSNRWSCSAPSEPGGYPSCLLSGRESPRLAPCPVQATSWDRKPAGRSQKG